MSVVQFPIRLKQEEVSMFASPLWFNQFPAKLIMGTPFQWVMWLERDENHMPPSKAECPLQAIII
jgi:hypothetical protein